MYRKSAVGKKQQFAFSGGTAMEDRHGILLIPSWSRGAAPTLPLHLCTALPRPSFSCCPLQTPLLISPAKFPVLSVFYEFLMPKQEPALLQLLPPPQTSLSPELWGKQSQRGAVRGAEAAAQRALCAHFIEH